MLRWRCRRRRLRHRCCCCLVSPRCSIARLLQKIEEEGISNAKLEIWFWSVPNFILNYVKTENKQSVFYGPYIVHELRGPNAVELRGMPSCVPEIVNLSFIKPFYSSPNRFNARPTTDIAMPVQQQGMEEPE